MRKTSVRTDRVRVAYRAMVAVVTAALLAMVGLPPAAADDWNVVDVLPLRGNPVLAGFTAPRWDFYEGDAMDFARFSISNPLLFGPAGVVPHEVVLHPPVEVANLTADDLVGIDVVVSTLIGDASWGSSPAAAAALDQWVRDGGGLIVTEEHHPRGSLPGSTFLSSYYGLTGPSASFAAPVGPDTHVVGTVLAPGNHPVVDGPFGQTTTFTQHATVTYYTSLGSYATPLAVNDAYRWPSSCSTCPLPVDATQAGTTIAVINPDVLEPGAGPVVFVSDTDTFTNAYAGYTVGGAVTNPELWRNTFAWVIDPTVPPEPEDTDNDGTPDYADDNAFAPVSASAPVDPGIDEGAQAAAHGSFTDGDGDALTITKTSGAGIVTDNGDGTWGWQHTAGDNGTGEVVVAADDGDHDPVTQTFTWTAGNVAPSVDAAAFTTTLGACPATGTSVTASLSGTFADPGADAWTVDVDWDYDGLTFTADSTSATNGREFTVATAFSSAGPHTAAVRITDDDAAASGPHAASNTFRIASRMSPLLSPFNTDGSSVWKHGSTIPMKIRIQDCAGNPVPGLAPKVGTQQLSAADPGSSISEAVSTSVADTGNTMRYDAATGQYVFNFASKALTDANASYLMFVREPGSIGVSPTGAATAGQSWEAFSVRRK